MTIYYHHQQVKTKSDSIEWLCKSKHFISGIFDASLGEPFAKDYDLWSIDAQWNYERGRIWAIAHANIELFEADGKTITRAAREAFQQSLKTRVLL